MVYAHVQAAIREGIVLTNKAVGFGDDSMTLALKGDRHSQVEAIVRKDAEALQAT